jgi:hypothetical protein
MYTDPYTEEYTAMGQAMVRISERARQTLREIAQSADEPMQAVLEKAVEEYRRRHFLERVSLAYERLREDPAAWSEMQVERDAWDQTLKDGLAQDESWTDEREVRRTGGGESR